MHGTTIIGVDCATAGTKVGIARALVDASGCVLLEARTCGGRPPVARQIAEWMRGAPRVLLALDAPLGWPQPLGEAISTHTAGAPLGYAANDMFRRETDRFVKFQLGKQSLDVGADRIARTAHSALSLLEELRQITGEPLQLAWQADFHQGAAAIEVYPAATLRAHGITSPGSRKDGEVGLHSRLMLIEKLSGLLTVNCAKSAMEANVDAMDAALCVLAGHDFLQRQAYPPEDVQLARREGWIWVRRKVH
jgi:predicted RNase H-like nuclease